MYEDRIEGLFLGFIAGSIGTLILFCVFVGLPNDVREQAIEAGAAEYLLVDPATGATEFRFKSVDQGEGE